MGIVLIIFLFIFFDLCMNHNITTNFIQQHTLLTNLATEPVTTVEKYILRALSLVGSYINAQQFYDEGTDAFTFPEPLQNAVLYIVEVLYIDKGMFAGANSIQSEKIGDYAYSKKQDTRVMPLDLPANIIALLDPYRSRAGNIAIDVGWYDREYEI